VVLVPLAALFAGAFALTIPLVVLLPLAAVAVLVLVVLTGDTGAKSVWGDAAGSSASVALD
jgi:hypothetical protein